ncbi:hypothetical protein SmJEL517_g01831 [Synchytrium microbalum]|uniref:tRNA pseudouridine synthase n=1 Tax=Synchytrium microbalum TaxID=1806994 RepID=A0A507C8Y0_9FUNG|nr:uncharacterized protein SmJEL517_g01831 [Synchytrium microbalum]TPX35981.1 hypothetical protein SmJEL517_g01831 [Synchytrium microbalum]
MSINTPFPSIYDGWTREQLISRLHDLEHPTSSTPNPTTSTTQHQKTKPSKRPPKQYDFTKTSCRPIALKLAYLGHEYHGFAGSENDTVTTIETHLFHALTTVKLIPDRSACGYSRCGRTDKGVSAFDQVVGLFVRSVYPAGIIDNVVKGGTYRWEDVAKVSYRASKDEEAEENVATDSSIAPPSNPPIENIHELDYPLLLNKLLPPTIRILAWSPVLPTFSARYNCLARAYRYYFTPSPNLDIAAMKTACQDFLGVHDYTNFCKVDPSRHVSHIRYIDHVGIYSVDEIDALASAKNSSSNSDTKPLIFYVKGRAFLWHQVRCMMAILFLIGSHLEPTSIISTLLSTPSESEGRPTYDLAPEHPLVLAECEFPKDMFAWRFSRVSRDVNVGIVKEVWREVVIKGAMVEYLVQCAESCGGGVEEEEVEGGRDVAVASNSRRREYTPVLLLARAASQQSRLAKLDTKAA